jgi:D-serine deaminase-like pyridoxal phosphate-dependent protein
VSTASTERPWYAVENANRIESPALLVYPDRVDENIRRMIAIAGGVTRLRPHAKTHKSSAVTARCLAAGITKFKSATIAETEMLAEAGAADVLLAYQPVGPNIDRFVDLIETFPQTSFACLVDNLHAAERLSAVAAERGLQINVFLDIDCGQHRTGIAADDGAIELYKMISTLPRLKPLGLHAYDGQIHGADLTERKNQCETAFAPVAKLRADLQKLGLPCASIVAGGTPTFPFHAQRPDVECSPGTCVYWDFGYRNTFQDLDFLVAAVLLTRVISKPGPNSLCLDLGHKAIASENPPPRVEFLNLPDARAISHSEEHLVIESESAGLFNVGDCLYGVPRHICPTVALHKQTIAIQGGLVTGEWPTEARDRHLTI